MRRIFLGTAVVLLGVVAVCYSAEPVADGNKAVGLSTALKTGGGQKYIEVKAKIKSTDEWKIKQTRTIDSLEGFSANAAEPPYTYYRSRKDIETGGNGFFGLIRTKGRWWLTDPDGYLFYNVGMAGVYRGTTEAAIKNTEKKFKTPLDWAEFTTTLLRKYGFTTAMGWTEAKPILAAKHSLPYALSWDFLGAFGESKNLTVQQAGHLGYAGDCIPVFHPEFEKFCDEYAKRLEPTRSDIWLIGHFSDNELPVPANMLDRSLKLDVNNPNLKYGQAAAQQWLDKRKGRAAGMDDINDTDRAEFIGYAFDTYYRITTGAIRRYDPNHLCLGSRLHGKALRYPTIFRAAGKHLDIVSVNYYSAWTPDPNRMEMWNRESGRPFMVTEFYAKGADSGLANNTGAGWTVETQKDRGLFYQNFTLGLLENKNCVGWNWFKYQDNNPADLGTDPSNRDSNKGIVNKDYEPYTVLLDEMKKVNDKVYNLIDYFDAKNSVPAVKKN